MHDFEKKVLPTAADRLREVCRAAPDAKRLTSVSAARRRAMARMIRFLPVAIPLFLSPTGKCYAATYDSLLGTFGLIENGKLTEFVRIEHRQQKYFLSRKHGGEWLAPVEVDPVTRAQLEAIVKEPVKVEFEGLGNDRLALLKVPEGWKLGTFICRTGYWVATLVGPVEVQKL
jgi:hypothetical protein